MKKVLFILLITVSVCCKKNRDDKGSALWFHVEIYNPQNIDCGFPEIIFLTNQNEAYQVIGNDRGIYIARGLPNATYRAGEMFWARIRKPESNEAIACTALGPAWAHVFITENKKWD